MSTWKKILTEDDGNLATKNLSTASARTFQLTSSNTLTFLSQHGTEFLKFTSGPVTPNADSVSIEAAALDIRHTVGSLGGVLALRAQIGLPFGAIQTPLLLILKLPTALQLTRLRLVRLLRLSFQVLHQVVLFHLRRFSPQKSMLTLYLPKLLVRLE